jgi:hypothetical protein
MKGVEMPKRLKNYMVDQFEEPLRLGECYGMRFRAGTKVTVWVVTEIIRDTLIMSEIDTAALVPDQPEPSPHTLTGRVHKYTNLSAGLLVFVRLDRQYREITRLAEPVKAQRARNLRFGLRKIAKEAERIRAKQRLLIQEVAGALEGSADPTDIGDMAATFVRDGSDGHVTIDALVRVFVESLDRSETE